MARDRLTRMFKTLAAAAQASAWWSAIACSYWSTARRSVRHP